MYKNLLFFTFVLFISGFFLIPNSNAGSKQKFHCGQNIDEIGKLTFLSIHKRYLDLKFYNLQEDKITIKNIDFKQIAYIFWKNHYIGYAVYINDKMNSKLTKKYLYDSLGLPHDGDQKFKTWSAKNEIVIFTKFSLHQARILFICKNMGIELKQIFDEIKMGVWPH